MVLPARACKYPPQGDGNSTSKCILQGKMPCLGSYLHVCVRVNQYWFAHPDLSFPILALIRLVGDYVKSTSGKALRNPPVTPQIPPG